MNHTGTSQTGLPSSEAPDISRNIPESLYHTGMSHVGTFSVMPGAIKVYSCKGRIRAVQRSYFCVTGIPKFLRNYVYQAQVFVCTDSINFIYMAKGKVVLLNNSRYKVISSIQASLSSAYKVMSTIVYKSKAYYTVAGLLKGNHDILFRAKGMIRAIGKQHFLVRSNVIPLSFSRYLVIAKNTMESKINYIVKVLPCSGQRSFYTANGTIRQKLNQMYKTTGTILNTVGDWMITIKGNVNIAAFVASVPKRMQDFVTNKRWFK